jgi:hypothetical protein
MNAPLPRAAALSLEDASQLRLLSMLGVFTLIVLMRPAVKAAFNAPPSPHA